MVRPILATGEFYHVYNRGVEKRHIFSDEDDLARFLQSLNDFNNLDAIGSIYENTFRELNLGSSTPKRPVVSIVAYCLNPNHYHLLLQQTSDNGISKFMHKLGTGYTNYFNEKYKRKSGLFQGRYKAKHVNSNEYLLHLSVYINLNNKFPSTLGSSTPKLSRSSWGEYLGNGGESLCHRDIVSGQFKGVKDYKMFAEETFAEILENKEKLKELENVFPYSLGS